MTKKLIIIINITIMSFIHTASFADDKDDKQGPPSEIEVNYEHFSADDDFSQKVYGVTSDIYMGSIADLAFTSGIEYYRYDTDTKKDHYFKEELHSLNYSLMVQGESIFFYGKAAYNSDKLFERAKDLSYMLMPTYKIYQYRNHMFYIGALYVSDKIYMGKIDGWRVVPVAAYMYMSRDLRLILGPQSSIFWQMLPFLSYQLDADVELTGETSLNIEPSPYFTISALARSNSDDFKIADRENKDEILVKKGYDAGIRLQTQIGPIALWGYAGYAFNNEYELTDEEAGRDRLNREIDNGWIYRAGINGTF